MNFLIIKKLNIILFILCFTTSCEVYKYASNVSNQCYIGMPIKEFLSIAGNKASLEAMEAGYTVYRINDYDSWTGALIDTKFYYFDSNAKLVKIDGGQFKQQRYQIETIIR